MCGALSHVGTANRGGQFAVAGRKLDREFFLRRCHRRPAARSVLTPYPPRTELLRGPIARYAREPRHRNIQCRLYDGEYVRLEHIAAMCRDCGSGRVCRSHQRADRGHVDARGGHHDGGDVPYGRRRKTVASRFRRQDGLGRWGNGRRPQQHAHRASILRIGPRVPPLRFDRRSRDDSAAIQPSLSRKAAYSSGFGYRHFDRRVIGVGDRSLAARRRHHRRCRARVHVGIIRAPCNERPCSSTRRRDPAHRSAFRGALYSARPSSVERSPGSRVARQTWHIRCIRKYFVSLSEWPTCL